MEHKKAFFNIIALMHLLSLIFFLFIDYINLSVLLSYEFAFFSILLIVFASYLSYKKVISIQAKYYEKKIKTIPLIFIKKKQNFSKNINFKLVEDDLNFNFKDKIYFFTVFFTFFKFITYMILVAGFLFLLRQGKLNILAYIIGISSLLVCIFAFTLYVKKYESKKNY